MGTASIMMVIGLMVVAPALLWELVPLQYTIWDGGYDLTVNVTSTAGPLRSVSCKPCAGREAVDFVLNNRADPEAKMAVVADPSNGGLLVRLPISGRTSPMGREVGYFQLYHFLVVVGTLQDGRELVKVMEIPDGRKSRAVEVSLP